MTAAGSAVAALLACTFAWAETINVTIEGLNDELTQAVRANLQLEQYIDRDITPVQARRLFNEAEEEIRVALQPYGYYNPEIDAKLERTAEGFMARFRIDRGEPVRVGKAEVRIEGPAPEVPAVKEALDAFEPDSGDRLDHGEYENSKSMIEAALRSVGFLGAELERHRVEVRRSTNSADIDLAWNGGPRYRLGEVRFPDVQFSDRFLRRYIPWKEDEYYSAEKLLEFQQRLVDADYFSSVAVQPNVENAENAVVPIDVLLVPAKRTVYTASAYMSTDSGPGARLGVERRWMNSRGHKAKAEVEYSQRLEALSTTYRIPRPGTRNRTYNLGATYRDEETDTSRSHATRLVANEVRQWRGFTRTVGLQFLDGGFTIAEQLHSSTLFFAEASVSRKKARDLLFPLQGESLNVTLRVSPGAFLSDTGLASLLTEAKWIRTVGERNRLLLRASLGAMEVGSFDALPPELRFFAGGDRSVRGFDYQAIGEVNSDGLVIGGRFLTVGSAEYEHFFKENWGAAVFVDAGDAYNAAPAANVGAGIGARWRSPIGLLRLDFAKPIVTDLEDSFRIHLTLGPDL